MTTRLRVAFVAGKDSNDPRNRVVLRGLRQNGIAVVDCTRSGHWLSRYLSSPIRLEGYWRRTDATIVGFLGHPLLPIVRAMTRRLVEDRGWLPANSPLAEVLKCLETRVYAMADRVLVDTQANIDFLVTELGIPRQLLVRSFVGTDDSVFYPREQKLARKRFIVHFHGSYQRLHGTRYIIEAAAILRSVPDVEFRLVGNGITFARDLKLASRLRLNNLNFLQPVTYKRLAELVSEADLCLGAFGLTGKAQRVIPAKVFDAMASRKPVVTGDTSAARELLEHLHDAYLCKCGDPVSLANAITELKDDVKLRSDLAQHAYSKFHARCCPRIIGHEIAETLNGLCADRL
jgi:glycosyltransferase involved in cell wall biosynthesis